MHGLPTPEQEGDGGLCTSVTNGKLIWKQRREKTILSFFSIRTLTNCLTYVLICIRIHKCACLYSEWSRDSYSGLAYCMTTLEGDNLVCILMHICTHKIPRARLKWPTEVPDWQSTLLWVVLRTWSGGLNLWSREMLSMMLNFLTGAGRH